MADDLARQNYYGDRDAMIEGRYYDTLARQGMPSASSLASAYVPEQQDPASDITGSGHALPIPRGDIPNYVPPRPEPLPPSAGYVGTGGAIANIAGNFLNGYLAGRENARAKAADFAKQKLTSSWKAYQMALAVAQNPDLPDAARQSAAESIPGLKSIYIDQVRAYSGAPAGQKGQKQGGGEPPHGVGKVTHGAGNILGHVASMFVGKQKPQMFDSGMADLLDKVLPGEAPPLSPAQQAQRAAAQNALAAQQGPIAKEIASAGTVGDLQQKRDQALQQLTAARAKGDKAAEADLQAQIRQYETRMQGLQQKQVVPGALEAQQAQVSAAGAEANAAKQKFDNEQAAWTALQQPGMDVWHLPSNYQQALGINPAQAAEVNAYLGAVGKPGGFASPREAIIAMQMDRAKANAAAYGLGRNISGATWQAIKLEHPDWTDQQVSQEWLMRRAGTAEEKQKPLDAEKFAQARNLISEQIVQSNPELKGFFHNYGDDKKPNWAFNQNAAPGTGFLGFFADDPVKFAAAKNAAAEKAWAMGDSMAIPDDQLTQMFGPKPQSLGGPATSSTPGGPAAGGVRTPSSAGSPQPSAPPSPQNPMVQWQVTDSTGKVTPIWMTPQEQAARAQDPKYKGFKWERVPAVQPQQSSTTTQAPPFDMRYTQPLKPPPASASASAVLSAPQHSGPTAADYAQIMRMIEEYSRRRR